MKLTKAKAVAAAVAIALSSTAVATPTIAAPSPRCSNLLNYSLASYRAYFLTGWSAIFNWGLDASAQRRQEC
jgi:hypothetical protein